MQSWAKVSLLLCTFGFLREIRPSEPFVSEFLLGEWRNITQEALYQDVYPVGTYSYLSLLVVVFLVTDYLKYKPLIIASGLSGIVIYSVLLWTSSLEWLQVSQFFYGFYMATEVAYYTYMFAKVEEDKYDKVASYTRSAALLGRFVSGVSSQLLVSFYVLNLRDLNYITLSSQILATLWAVFLPSVDRSVYFHRELSKPIVSSIAGSTTTTNEVDASNYGLRLLWEHVKSAYSHSDVVAWSAWYALSSAGFFQVQTYMQILWKEIEPNQENLLNGMIEAVLTVLGAAGALLGGVQNFEKKQNLMNFLPAFAAALQGAAVLAASFANALWISYVGYICLGIIFHYMITISSFQIAKKLVYNSCFGLIFGINTLVALAIQSLLTMIAISPHGLELDIRGQYMAYALYYVIVSVLALVAWIVSYCGYRRKLKEVRTQSVEAQY